jgi:ribosomal protein S21
MAKCNGVYVSKKTNETFEKLFQRFRNAYKESKISKQVVDSSFYEKPSKKRRDKKNLKLLKKRRLLEEY